MIPYFLFLLLYFRSTQILTFDHCGVKDSKESSSLQCATQVLASPHDCSANYGSVDASRALDEEKTWHSSKAIELLQAK